MTTGERIRELRGKKKLKEFAIPLEIGEQQISNIENGSRNLTSDLAIKICDMYDCSMDWLYGRTDSQSFQDESEIQKRVEELVKINTDQSFVIDSYKRFVKLTIHTRFCNAFFQKHQQIKIYKLITYEELDSLYKESLWHDMFIFLALDQNMLADVNLIKIHQNFLEHMEKEIAFNDNKEYINYLTWIKMY